MNGIDIGKAVGALLMAVVAVVAIGYIGNALVPAGGEGEVRVVNAARGGADVAAPPEAEKTMADASEEAAAEVSEEAVAEVVEEAAAPSAPGIDLAMADVAAGQKLFKKCGICHTVAAGGPNRIGPNLFGIVGRGVGGYAGFRYSSAMSGLGGTWTVEMLDGFLAKPKEFLPDTKMKFSGLKKAEDRTNLIAYLATLAD
jgi:cytochrome c